MRRLLSSSQLLLISLLYNAALLVVFLIRIQPDEIEVSFKGMDKLFHFCAFFGLALLWELYYLRKKKNNRPSLWILGATIGFGIIVEILQLEATTYRSFEGWDIFADALGAITAYVVLRWIFPLMNKK